MLLGLGLMPPQRRHSVELLLAGVAASSAILALILFGLNDLGDKNDFISELWPSYELLHAGHVGGFLEHSPSYIGAAVWRAPFALVAMACGAGWRLTFFITAIPCYAALPLFGMWFAARVSADPVRQDRIVLAFAFVTVLDPVVWYAGLLGHPEELVGIALALAAIVLAVEGRPWLAVVLAVLAVLNKPGLAELLPVVLVVMGGRFVRPALGLCLAAAALYAVYNLTPLATDIHLGTLAQAGTTGGDFFPFQLLWWLGRGEWLVLHEHVLLVPVCVALAGAWWYRRADRGSRTLIERRRDALWLAAFVLLFRTAVEPWDNVYYNLPLVICLLGLEADRFPAVTIAASLGALLLVPTNRILPVGPDAQAVLYTVVAVPVLTILAWRAYGLPGAREARVRRQPGELGVNHLAVERPLVGDGAVDRQQA